MKKKYNSFDLAKFIMAFMVVAGHTEPLVNCSNNLINSLVENAIVLVVPFFFLAAGFLLGKKLEYPFYGDANEAIIKDYLFKIIKLYLIWMAVYTPLAIYFFISASKSPLKAIYLYARGFFLTGEQYNSWHLWYLLSTIYALLFLLFLLKRKQPIWKMLIIVSIIYIISIIITMYALYKGDLPSYLVSGQTLLKYTISGGRIFRGIFYIPVGMIISKWKIPAKVSWGLFIVTYIANVCTSSVFFSSILEAVCAIGLFGIIENIQLPDSSIYPKLRKISTVVYFMHMYIWSFYYKIVYNEPTRGLDSFLVTSVVCLFLGIVYVIYKDNKRKLCNVDSVKMGSTGV